MNNIFKRVLSIALCSALLLLTTPTVAVQAYVSNEEALTISEHFRAIEDNFDAYSLETGINSEIYLARQLVEYSMWLDFAIALKKAKAFDKDSTGSESAKVEVSVYAYTFANMLNELNTLDKTNSGQKFIIDYKSVSTITTDLEKNIGAGKFEEVSKVIHAFQKSFADMMDGYYSQLPTKDYEKDQNFSLYKSIAGELWKCDSFIKSAYTDITECLNLIEKRGLDNSDVDISDIKDFYKEIKAFSSTYSLWFSMGQNNEILVGLDNEIMFDQGKTYLENIANVQEDSVTCEVATPPSPEFSLLYLACFASSAVYVPFHSYTGDTCFSQALGSLTDNSEAGNAALTFYNNIKSIKKPLYARELNADGDPTGPGELISINQFIENIENGTDFCLVTVQGDLIYSNDIGDWIYTQEYRDLSLTGKSGTSETETTTTTSGNTSDDSTDSDDLIEEDDSTSSSVDAKLTLQVTNVVSTEKRLNEPVFMSGTSYNRVIDNTTLAVMTNILKELKDMSDVDNPNTEYLYVNAFGDIVDKDDMVIFPGSANPIYYGKNTYYPYTAAFMNTYPSIIGGTGDFRVSGNSSIGKYIFLLSSEDDNSIGVDIKGFNTGTIPESVIAMKILDKTSLDVNSELIAEPMYNTFAYNSEDVINVLQAERKVLEGNSIWDSESSELYYNTVISASNTLAYRQTVVFPYDSMEDDNYTLGKLIAGSCYKYLAKDTKSYKDLGKLNTNYMIHNVAISAFEGTTSVQSLLNSLAVAYDNFVNSTGDRILGTAKKVSRFIFEAVSGAKSILGINSFYEDSLTGTMSNYFIEYWLIVMLVIIGIAIVCILKYQERLRSALFMLLSTLVFALVFVIGLPVYGQFYYNLLSNNVANSFTSSMIGTIAEGQIGNTSEFGSLGSLTVYRYPIVDLKETYDGFGIKPSGVSAGNKLILDGDAGFYLEGDSLKYDISTLFSNITIRASKTSAISTLSVYREVDDNIDYYTPLVPIMDCMVDKLNTLANVYSIPRSSTLYKTSQTRTQYLVYDYVNSEVFTKGHYEAKLPNDTIGMTDDDKTAYLASQQALADTLEEAFGKNTDWLGLTPLLTEDVIELGSGYQDTLWFSSMERKGIYKYAPDKDGNRTYTYSKKEMAKLIYYVNLHTRDYVYDLGSIMDSYSDDTLVKLISLKATQCFSQYLSQAGNYVYPVAFNNSEYCLGDIVTCIFVEDYTAFKACDYDLIEYLGSRGTFTLVLADVAMAILFLLSIVNRIVLLVGYYLFVLIVLWRMMSHRPLSETFTGFLKAAVVCILGSFITVVTLFITGSVGNVTVKSVALALVSLALLSIYIAVSRAVLKDLGHFGNTRLSIKQLPFNKRKPARIKGEFEQVSSPSAPEDDYSVYEAYKSDSSVEDIYKDRNKFY